MEEEQFALVSMYVLVSGLILYCMFIMYRLGKDSNAGKFGMFVIFLALGLGMFGFVFKQVVMMFLE